MPLVQKMAFVRPSNLGFDDPTALPNVCRLLCLFPLCKHHTRTQLFGVYSRLFVVAVCSVAVAPTR